MFFLEASQTLEYVLGSILLVLGVFLVAIILMQSAKDKSLSGTIAGGSETFFGRSGGTSKDKILSMLTIIGSVLFVIVTVVLVIVVN